jgi:hypothetical protein
MMNLKKDVEACKMDSAYFYNSFSEVPEEINIYGMSLGEVDFPY